MPALGLNRVLPDRTFHHLLTLRLPAYWAQPVLETALMLDCVSCPLRSHAPLLLTPPSPWPARVAGG